MPCCARRISVTSSGTVKFGNQPLPGATVTATEGNHRAVTTTDESGAYELHRSRARNLHRRSPDVRVPDRSQANSDRCRGACPRCGRSSCRPSARESPESSHTRPQQQAGGFRAAAGTTEAELDQIAAAAPQDNAPPQATASSNANEAFLVNGSLSNGLQTGQDDFGLRGPVFGMQGPGGSAGSGHRRPAWWYSRCSRRSWRRWRWWPGRRRIRRRTWWRIWRRVWRRPWWIRWPWRPARRAAGGNGGFIGNRANRGRQGIHGNVSFQWHGADTDAKPFSLSGQPAPQPDFNNYRWSAVLGGPVTHSASA